MIKDNTIPVDIGNMRHRIVIRHGIRVPDGMGGYTLDSGAVYQTVWAEVVEQYKSDVTGDWDKRIMNQIETQYKKKFNIYYDSTIINEMLIDYDGYRYHITNKKKLGEINFFLQIEAEASERDKI